MSSRETHGTLRESLAELCNQKDLNLMAERMGIEPPPDAAAGPGWLRAQYQVHHLQQLLTAALQQEALPPHSGISSPRPQ
jgi:hypothetical protein